MELEVQVAIASAGLASLLASIGLFLNFLAFRQNNKIAVSSSLCEASKVLSDELVFLSKCIHEAKGSLEMIDAPHGSEERSQKEEKLTELIESWRARQKEIDGNQEILSSYFKNPAKAKIGEVNEAIAMSYSCHTLAEASYELIQNIKTGAT